MNTKAIGNITEVEFMRIFVGRGFTVSQPFGDNAQYDFILDVKDRLFKVQCKHMCMSAEGKLDLAATRTNYYKGKAATKHYDKVDLFFGYNIETGLSCVLDAKQFPKGASLRTLPPKNGQIKGINYLEDYSVEKFIKQISEM